MTVLEPEAFSGTQPEAQWGNRTTAELQSESLHHLEVTVNHRGCYNPLHPILHSCTSLCAYYAYYDE